MPRTRLLPALALSLAAVRAGAQQADREVGSSANAWFDVTTDLWLTPGVDVQLGGKIQRAHMGAEPQLAELRVGVVRPLGKRFRLAGGGLLAHNTPYDPFPASAPYGERRLWQYLLQDHRLGPVAVQHRYRLEERWIDRPRRPVNGVEQDADVSFTLRARYRLQGTLPVGRAGAAHAPYVIAWDELFKSAGPHASTVLIDQNRVYAGLGVRWSPTVRAEAGYIEQRIVRANGRQLEHGHTVQVALWLTRPAPRRQAPAANR